MQTVLMDGYLNKSEKGYHFFAADGDKRAMACFSISTRRPYAKKTEEGYYPYDFVPARAYGQTAEFINNTAKARDGLMFGGYLVSDPAKESNGVTYPAHLTFIVERVEYAVSNGSKSDNNTSAGTAPAATNSVSRQAATATKKRPQSPF